MAISGVDLALWDLRGKRENRSTAELLGASPGNSITSYAAAEISTNGIRFEPGLGAYKLHGIGRLELPDQENELVSLLTEARCSVGEEVDLMADAAMGWRDAEAILRFCERVADLRLAWLEEPLPADDLDGYAWLCERSPVPIAGGEHEFTAAGCRHLMERGCHHIYQPDACWSGGMTELVKIYELADTHGVRVCPHRGAETWGLHAIAALDRAPLAECERPWMRWVGGVEQGRGLVRTKAAPGFGVDFSDLAPGTD